VPSRSSRAIAEASQTFIARIGGFQ
jgi:hypothetical protein